MAEKESDQIILVLRKDATISEISKMLEVITTEHDNVLESVKAFGRVQSFVV